jgi:hypothetical protein
MTKILLALILGLGVFAFTPQVASATDTFLNVSTCIDAVRGAGTNDNDRDKIHQAFIWAGYIWTGQTATYLGYNRVSSSRVEVYYSHHMISGSYRVGYRCNGDLAGQPGLVASCEDESFIFPDALVTYMQTHIGLDNNC